MNYRNLYVKYLTQFADFKKPLRVVLDCSNGTAGVVLKYLKFPNSKFIILNSKIDGRFPAHGPNPLLKGATNQAAREILKQKADLGAVFDADADRVVFLDELGKVMPVHAVTFLLSLKAKPPYVADTYLTKILKHLKLLNPYPSQVGTYFVKRMMKKIRASLGIEFSGHYYFRETKNTDSAILTVIKVMNILSELPYKMSQFSDLLPDFYFEQWNVRTENPKKILKKIKSYSKRGVVFIVRPSNTEPLVRFFLGSKDKKVFQKEIKKLKTLLS